MANPHAHNDEDDDEDPKDSVAAHCIRFSHCLPAAAHHSSTQQQQRVLFAPVFTHQCFPGEYIPGYRPLETEPSSPSSSPAPSASAISISRGDDGTPDKKKQQQQQRKQRKHSSFEHAAAATHSLAIAIALAPACDACTVSLDCRPLKRARERETANDDDDDKEQQEDPPAEGENNSSSSNQAAKSPTNINNDDDDDSVELGSEDSDSEDDDDNDVKKETPPPKRLSEQEICAQLQKFLPPIVAKAASRDASFQYLKTPIGTIVAEYSHARDNDDDDDRMDFCLSVCLGADCAAYHSAVQKLAPWYIESASDIDPAEEDGKAWKILYLFRKHHNQNAAVVADDNPSNPQCYCYSLAGYMTLYHFESPFRKPVGGTIVRVCQALILPLYHRMGLGKRLLHAVFDIVCSGASNNNNIVEVNAEDPAPAFSALRDVVDWERYQQTGRQWFVDACSCQEDITKAEFFAALKESDALEITPKALTTARQIQTVHELDRLHRLQEHLQQNSIDDEQRELLEKRFRLMVKQRLNRQNREDIVAQCGQDKEALKKLLSEMFEPKYKHYLAILKRPPALHTVSN